MADIGLVSWKIDAVRNPNALAGETGYTIEMTDANGRTYTVKGTGTIQVSDPEGVSVGPTLHKPAINETLLR